MQEEASSAEKPVNKYRKIIPYQQKPKHDWVN